MTTREFTTARELLAKYCDHFDYSGGASGDYLVAHWLVGGLTRFLTVASVVEWVQKKETSLPRLRIGLRLRAARLGAKVSQFELSLRSGIAQPHLSRVESGLHPRVSVATVERIADALGISPRDLFVD